MKRIFTFLNRKGVIDSTIKEQDDAERCVEDLIYDVRQKRKLTSILFKENKRWKLTFLVYLFISIIVFSSTTAYFRKDNFEKELFETYYSDFKKRFISNYNLGVTNSNDFNNTLKVIDEYDIVVEYKILYVLGKIEKQNFEDAILALGNIETPESAFLEALCYVRKGDNKTAAKRLSEIISKKGLYAGVAQEILDAYHQHNQNNRD